MNLQKLNPWNWFKHEERQSPAEGYVPIKHDPEKAGLAAAPHGFMHPMWQLHQEIDRLFEDAFRGFGSPAWSNRLPALGDGSQGMFKPSLNVASDNGCYQVSVEVPGLSKDDVSIDVRDDMLIIQGQKQEEMENKDRHFYRVERSYGAFQRTLALPDDANADEITANLKDGVLTLTIPRREIAGANVRRIDIH